jgi:release factor glutamine methyltransferase
MIHEYSLNVPFKSMKRKSIKFAVMTIHEANLRLLFQLYTLYDDSEATNIANLVMENLTGWKRIDRVINKHVKLSAPVEQQLEKYIDELRLHTPVQYVLHEAWFGGMKLYVDENVLIPRQETEELVQLVKDNVLKERNKKNDQAKRCSVLDVGTGSGCIAIAIKKNIPDADVYAVDVSEGALKVAAKNAHDHHADLQLLQVDILNQSNWNELPSFNFIVSNPPYIPLGEKDQMEKHVTDYEPHVALFVSDNDPLIFYKAIMRFAEQKLLPGGKIFVEVHENLAGHAAGVFASYEVEVKKDMQQKNRMIVASKR